MIKIRIKRGAVALSYRLGLIQAGMRLGDSLAFQKGYYFFSLSRKVEESFLVLMYHRVNDKESHFMIDAIPTSSFDQQMKYLAHHCNVLSLEEILDCLQSGELLPKRCVAITFDDGYEDNYLNAFPVLEKYHLPATIFLTAGCIDTGESLWFDRVLYAFEQTRQDSLNLPEAGLTFSFQTPMEKLEAAIQTLYSLMAIPDSKRLSQIDTIFSRLRIERPARLSSQMLKWSQVQEMADKGISFGSHTLTHPILSNVSLPEAEQELIGSKRLIESHLHRPVRLFAYPKGKPSDYSVAVLDLVKKAGYEAALTTIPGANSQRQDLYQLKRIKSWQYDLPSFALGLSYYHLASSEG